MTVTHFEYIMIMYPKRVTKYKGVGKMYPNIEAERARKGLTKEELATVLGVDRKTLRKWVNVGNIPMDKLNQMANFFGCTTDYLLGISTVR